MGGVSRHFEESFLEGLSGFNHFQPTNSFNQQIKTDVCQAPGRFSRSVNQTGKTPNLETVGEEALGTRRMNHLCGV